MSNNWIDSRFRPAMGEYVFDLLIITGSGFLEYFTIRRPCILFSKFKKTIRIRELLVPVISKTSKNQWISWRNY
jgi:hypothetical protein